MSKSVDLEFFYDCSSPWTCFAFTRIIPWWHRSAARALAPCPGGGVFNAVNREVYSARQAMFTNPDNKRRLDYYLEGLGGLGPARGRHRHHATGSPDQQRQGHAGAFYAEEQGLIVPYSSAVFSRLLGGVADISSDEVLLAICRQVGLDPDGFFSAIAGPRLQGQTAREH